MCIVTITLLGVLSIWLYIKGVRERKRAVEIHMSWIKKEHALARSEDREPITLEKELENVRFPTTNH